MDTYLSPPTRVWNCVPNILVFEQNFPRFSFNYTSSSYTDLTDSKNGPCNKIYRWHKMGVITFRIIASWLHSQISISALSRNVYDRVFQNLFQCCRPHIDLNIFKGFEAVWKWFILAKHGRAIGATETRTVNISILTWFCYLAKHALTEVLFEKKPWYQIRSTCHIEYWVLYVEVTGANVRKHGRCLGEANSH